MSLVNPQKLSPEFEAKYKAGEISKAKVNSYFKLVNRIQKDLFSHKVITSNEFMRWFQQGDFGREDIRHFLVQFSVFSNLFIVAQLHKTINSPTVEAMHSSKEILLNELGVIFRNRIGKKTEAIGDVEPDLVGTEGTIEGSTFRFAAAHFEWLLRMTSHVGLGFGDVGKRRHGTKSTLFFCDELSRLYGSDDPHTGLGASFSVENWAAAGFWKELVSGLEKFKKREAQGMPLAFFTWHDKVEDQHRAHTWAELQEQYFSMDLDEEKFFRGGMEMLNGIWAFWDGLNQDHLTRRGH